MPRRPFRNVFLSLLASSPASECFDSISVLDGSQSIFFLLDPAVVLLSRASDKCQKEKRKTVNGDDLLWAMATLGFEEYIDPLKIYLARYREVRGLLPTGCKF